MKKIIKPILIILLVIFVIFSILGLSFIYITEIRVTDIEKYTNSLNGYTVLFQAVGEPDWPFGDTKVKVSLLDENDKEIDSFIESISDDGSMARDSNIDIEWFDTFVQITLSGSEQSDEIYDIQYKK